jgi:hypothetical protein
MKTELGNGGDFRSGGLHPAGEMSQKNDWEHCAREAELIYTRETKNPGSQNQRRESGLHINTKTRTANQSNGLTG